MNYIIVGVKNGIPYYWCYDYTTEYRAKGALLTRAKVREKVKEFDTVEIRAVNIGLFCECAKWKTKEQIVNWFYNEIQHYEEGYDWLLGDLKTSAIKWAKNRYQYAVENF